MISKRILTNHVHLVSLFYCQDEKLIGHFCFYYINRKCRPNISKQIVFLVHVCKCGGTWRFKREPKSHAEDHFCTAINANSFRIFQTWGKHCSHHRQWRHGRPQRVNPTGSFSTGSRIKRLPLTILSWQQIDYGVAPVPTGYRKTNSFRRQWERHVWTLMVDQPGAAGMMRDSTWVRSRSSNILLALALRRSVTESMLSTHSTRFLQTVPMHYGYPVFTLHTIWILFRISRVPSLLRQLKISHYTQ